MILSLLYKVWSLILCFYEKIDLKSLLRMLWEVYPKGRPHGTQNTVTHIFKKPVMIRMLEKNEHLQTGLSHRWLFFLVTCIVLILIDLILNYCSWKREFFSKQGSWSIFFFPLSKTVGLTIKFLREDNFLGASLIQFIFGIGEWL